MMFLQLGHLIWANIFMNNTCLTFKLSLLLMFSFSQSSNADGVYGKGNAKIYEVPETIKTLYKYPNSK